MNTLSNEITGNNLLRRQAVIPPLKQKPEHHDPVEPNAICTKIQAEPLKRKPIKNILLVDDEEAVRKLFKEALEKFGYQVKAASDGKKGIKSFRKNPADLVITDIFMPEAGGHAFICEILQEFPETKILAITGKNTLMGIETELDIALSLGAIKGFSKPVRLSKLLDAIKEL